MKFTTILALLLAAACASCACNDTAFENFGHTSENYAPVRTPPRTGQ